MKQAILLIQQEKSVTMRPYPNISGLIFINHINKFFLGSDFLSQVYFISFKPVFIKYINNKQTDILKMKIKSK